MLQQTINFVSRQPLLKAAAMAALSFLPELKSRLEAVALGHRPAPLFVTELQDLSPHGQQIYSDLVRAVELHHQQKSQP